MTRCLAVFLAAVPLAAAAARGGRVTMSLDGAWEIEDSVSRDAAPSVFRHRVLVPGLADLATPPFPGAGAFDSRELIDNRIRRKQLPEAARITSVGIPRQERNYFWYRKRFAASARRAVAILKIEKAQFGTAVFLNGKPVGEHRGCFTAAYFDLTPLVRREGENELLVRLGAHPAAMPASVPAGTDFEKLQWMPGIYDSVSVILADNPVIETVQVAPRLATSDILVETSLKNYAQTPAAFTLVHAVRTWTGKTPASGLRPQRVTLEPGEERTFTQRIAIAAPHLWTPEDPFLYVVESSTGGDTVATRFGMREFRFDTATRRAYLNGKLYFLRGSNITLHRFFEDPHRAALPWDQKWVRRLLAEIPKRMHWNAFRFCIGPVPQMWLDIADETGLLIQYEYFIWTGGNGWHAEWDPGELTRELSEWVRDNWNHPSVVLWDACNETVADVLGAKIIPAVRKLDLSNRPWENGYNLPAGPDDPYEDHPYLFNRIVPGSTPPFRVTGLERMQHLKQSAAAHPTAHSSILNEYGWLWLNRDGSPTVLTQGVWDTLLGPNATGGERLKEWAYLLAGLTEFWRAGRYHAGVLHFVYLTCSYPGVFTSDHWRNVEKLELDPDFADYVGEAFKPLGVYLNLWQPEFKRGSRRRTAVVVTNDLAEPARGRLVLSVDDANGRQVAAPEQTFEVPAYGQQSYAFDLEVPDTPGAYAVRAAARTGRGATVSRRKILVK